jgi:hypothetical protein
MPYVFQETQLGEARPAGEFPSLSSEVYEETFAQAFEENPAVSMARGAELVNDYSSGGKKLDFMAASRKLKERGMDGDIKVSEGGITEDALNTLMFRKGVEKRRQEVFGQAEGGYGQGAARLGISLATGLVDPLNVAMAFIPVVGEARYTSMLAKAGSTLGRAGVRAGVGAVEGLAGAALIEPIIAGSRRYEQADYDMADSLLNVAFGGVFGAGLHSVGGAISDGVTHYRGAEPAWRGLESVAPAEIPLVQNLRQEIARGMDARDVARVTETWSPEARRAVAADVRAVTPAEAAHQALPPQVRENALKQAIIQAVSDEPVNVQPMIQSAAVKQTQTPEFQRWFGASKVVDEAGQPLRVYHGTASNIEKFDIEGTSGVNFSKGEGFVFFTDKPDAYPSSASDYAISAAGKHSGANIVPAFVRLENPLMVSADGYYNSVTAFDKQAADIRKQVEAGGHDGVIVRFSDGSGDSLIATTRPEQIKSAIGNSGRFDPSSASLVDPVDDVAKATAHAEKVLARDTDTGAPTADALKNATDEADLAQSDLKALADWLGEDFEDAELTVILEAAANSERWARTAELATVCLVRGG